MLRLRTSRAGVLAFVTCLVLALPAAGQDESGGPEARRRALELFRESEVPYREGRFDEAVRLLEEAYALHPEPVLLYNLARAYEGMGDPIKARDAYQRYLDGSPDAKDRGAIERRIQTLDAQIAEQKRLAEEKRRLEEERRRREREDRRKKPAREPPSAPAESKASIWPWVTAGAGVALVGTGAVFGVLAKSERDDAAEDPVHASATETFDRAETMATTANVLFIVGGMATAGGVTWILLSRSGGETQRQNAALALSIAPSGVALGGKW